MGRNVGDRNADYEARRDALLDAMLPLIASPEGTTAGLRQLASIAGVSVPTIAHYFGDRAGVVRAVFERIGELGKVHLRAVRTPTGSFEQSVHDLVAHLTSGLEAPPVVAAHVLGLREGPRAEETGIAYLRDILEPLLQAAEERLTIHILRGEMQPGNPRSAALALISPLLLAHLHQGPLCGASLRPLDLVDMTAEHTSRFIAAYRRPRRKTNTRFSTR